ncbi:hypothetical protein Trco_008351 [Trichoderma cornu-damae]|uniref:Uncharacterized protein n=1 Tax=Trichoderma cornu-damae TaxID=654480 RepID=A0A9P8TRD9_9HYPO|nr:hypothetical protein Trco_008351 [Trichoderma cornu-damae]
MKTSALVLAVCAAVAGALPSHHFVNTTTVANATAGANTTLVTVNKTTGIAPPVFSNDTSLGGVNTTHLGHNGTQFAHNRTHLPFPVPHRFQTRVKALSDAVLRRYM